MFALISCGRELPDISELPLEKCCRIEVDGILVNYFDFNDDAAGPPIVFLHGYSGSGFEASFLKEHLLNRRIIAPDLPGSGQSEKPEVDYNLSYYLSFFRAFVTELELDTFVLVGHSMGGKISSVFSALDGPGTVESLILLAPYGLDGEGGDIVEFLSNTGSLVDISFNLHSQTLIDVAVRLNVFHDPDRIPEELIDYIAATTFSSDDGVRALANITRNAIARDPIDWLLPEISVPTLVMWGRDDRVLDVRHATTFHDLIPGSELVLIEACGHMPHVEQREITAAEIERFLQRTLAPETF